MGAGFTVGGHGGRAEFAERRRRRRRKRLGRRRLDDAEDRDGGNGAAQADHGDQRRLHDGHPPRRTRLLEADRPVPVSRVEGLRLFF